VPRRRPGRDQPARARRRDGPAPSVLDVHALAARAPVRDAARDRRHGRKPCLRSSSRSSP
jgi:hypothetical protein